MQAERRFRACVARIVLSLILTSAVTATEAAERQAYEPAAEIVLPADELSTPRAVEEKDGYAYVLTREGTLYTYDISDLPLRESFVTYDTPVDRQSVYAGNGLVRDGDYLYAFGRNGIQTIDVHNPSMPALLRLTSDLNMYNLVRHEDYLIAAGAERLVVYSIAEPSNPTLLSDLNLGQEELVWSVAGYGRTLYACHFWSDWQGTCVNTLSVIDFSDPVHLAVLKTIRRDDLAYHLRVIGDRLLECTSNQVGLWDLSAPADPVLLTSQQAAGRVAALDGPHIVTNGSVFRPDANDLHVVATFAAEGSQRDGFPHGSAVGESFVFLAQTQRILVLNAIRPVLTANHASGGPGSFFTITGADFAPFRTATITVNGSALGEVATDSAGGLLFLLDTEQADEGSYVVTATADRRASAGFAVASGESAHPQEDDGPVFEVPPQIAYGKYSGGNGTAADPYQIAAAEDLMLLGDSPEDYDKHFILTADIDLDPNLPGGKVFDKAVIAPDVNDMEDWFQGTPFTGVFDGNGHTISHLTITGGSYLGLFGLAGSQVRRGAAFVKNLELVDTRITGTGNYVGGLAGSNSGPVTECCSSGVVSGNMYVGGLVGYSQSWMYGPGRIMDCYSMAAVSATTGSAGGLVGFNSGAIIRCYSTGPVSAPVGAGGLVGEPWEDWGGTVTDCFWDTETSGQATSTGGTGKTTLEMYAASTFVAWGACVSVWTIDDGRDYPRLVWENGPGRIIAGPTFAGGSGTIEDPFLIASAEDLDTLSLYSCHWDRHFKLVTDIDLSGRTWMGPVVLRFSGVFDGNGHTVSHLAITGGSNLGLFGELGSGARVSNLGLEAVQITGTGSYVGGLVGWNSGAVTRCHSTGAVSSNSHVGGLVGWNSGAVTRCHSTGAVSSNSHVGGLVGLNYGSINTSYCTGAVTGDSGVGGLIGGNYRGDVKRCYSTSAVVGNENVGGLIGNHTGGAVETCYTAGYVTGSGSVGGLVGLNESLLMDSYSLSIVSGNNRVGGLIGKNSNAVRHCYSAGTVNGDQYAGGLVGSNIFAAGTEIAESFWDLVSSGSSKMCGLGSCDNSLGKTTAEMQTAATFLGAGWDFVGEAANGTEDIWWIDEGKDYPRLWWEATELIVDD